MPGRQTSERRITIRAGDVAIDGELNDSPTADMVWDALPITASASIWGDEIYFSIPVSADEDDTADMVLVDSTVDAVPPMPPDGGLVGFAYVFNFVDGGVVVNDFIDMRKDRHRRTVEKTLRDAVKRDRARTKILRTSPFGLIEMTRQRIRPSLKRSVYKECPGCNGSGLVKSAESMAYLLCSPRRRLRISTSRCSLRSPTILSLD